MLKKGICVLLSTILMTTPVAYATHSVAPHSTEEESSNIEDVSPIEIHTPDGQILKYEVEYTDHSVITEHRSGNTTTFIEVIYDTGEMIETIYEGNQLVSTRKEINESVKNANQSIDVTPYFVFPVTYQNIGSVNFNTNSTGVAYNISVKCKEVSEEYNGRYDLNKNVTQAVQWLVSGLLGYLSPFSWITTKSAIANGIVDGLANTGVIKIATDGAIASITADYVEAYVTKYDVQYSNQYGASNTAIGTAIYVKSEGTRYNQTFYDDFYPQFLQRKDTGVASMMYYAFDAYGFPGVKSWSATRTVAYAKG